MSTTGQKPLALTAFLSHKYKAPAVNEFFFQLCAQAADVEFEVDTGSTATNVTRLERLIRNADAFLGVYPFDPDDVANPSGPELLDASKYFRLELDIAARARKPGLIFRDARYRGIFSVSPPISEVPFNAQEVLGQGAKPSSAAFTKLFTTFCRQVAAEQQYQLEVDFPEKNSNQVGILLPTDVGDYGYTREQVEMVAQAVEEARYEPVILKWPPVITASWITHTSMLNWMVVDIGPASTATGIVGFLHGAFKPMMRLRRVASAEAMNTTGPTGLALYDGFEVGYRKDIVRWFDSETLAKGVAQRIGSLDAGRRRISTLDEALTYFRSAALRKEAVFVSYAGADEEAARAIRDAFRKKFQQVFDYRDGKSIRPGQPWIKEIFDQLAVSPVGVPLLSSSYLQSGNCMHEFREMLARVDNDKMQLFPVKLKADDKFTMPPEAASLQYARFPEYGSADQLVEWIATNLKS